MKKIDMKLLSELLKDCKRSDRELAKVLGVSQPTVTRMRTKLVKEGMIRDWIIVPDFVKMGYEILAITSVKVKETMLMKMKNKTIEYFNNKPNVVMAAGGAQGQGMNGVIVSIHTSYSDFSSFLTNLMTDWGDLVEDHFTILVGLGERAIKPFSLKYLADVVGK
jgi:DNA-binding Lrp family transcriptional regulator